MPKDELNPLLLTNQLCFPLYAAARKIVAAYHPFLKELGLTYAQYVTMMVLWEEQHITMHTLGKRLALDSGTLTPVLKKLEGMGYLRRSRKTDDERVVLVELTEAGTALRARAEKVPHAMGCMMQEKGLSLTPEEVATLKEQLYRIIHTLEK
jgi:transcriptional regulator, MarR family